MGRPLNDWEAPRQFHDGKGVKMAITKDKIASLLVFAVVTAIVMTVLNAVAMPALGIFLTLMFSLFGLALIWFAEPLAEVACFSRGIPKPSPSGLIMVFGWIFLIGYPLLLAFVTHAI
jgi:FtsH-binding integral membrane protein